MSAKRASRAGGVTASAGARAIALGARLPMPLVIALQEAQEAFPHARVRASGSSHGVVIDMPYQLLRARPGLRESLQDASSAHGTDPTGTSWFAFPVAAGSAHRNPGGRATPTALARLSREGIRLPMVLAVALSGLPRGAVSSRVVDHRDGRLVELSVRLPAGSVRRRRRGLLRRDVAGEPGDLYSIVVREMHKLALERGLGLRMRDEHRRPTRDRSVAKSDWRYQHEAFDQPVETTAVLDGDVSSWGGHARPLRETEDE